jgi:hypothetical protein
MSCGGDNSNLDSCNCTFAEELFDQGLLVCEDRERCPRSCPICSTCLTILGCPDASGPGNRLETSTIIYIVIGAVILLVVGLALFHSRRRKQQQSDLNQQLISDADDKGMVDPSRDGKSGFEPPVVDSGNVNALVASAVIAGGIAGGVAWKSSKDNDSDSETDDCGESLDPTLQTADESMVDLSAGGVVVPTVRSEEEDAAPEDENEATKELHETDDKEKDEAEVPQVPQDNIAGGGAASNDSADIGAVRSAFLLSLENESSESNDAQDTETQMVIPESTATNIEGEEEIPKESNGATNIEATEGAHENSLEKDFSESSDSPEIEASDTEVTQEAQEDSSEADSPESNEAPEIENDSLETETSEPDDTEDPFEEDGADTPEKPDTNPGAVPSEPFDESD